ncbi:MAG: NACHT domain-containing protein [Polyangiaceae bacterium]
MRRGHAPDTGFGRPAEPNENLLKSAFHAGYDVQVAREQRAPLPFATRHRAVSPVPKARRLFGRGADHARVTAAFDAGERLVTLLGPPGIGKTSLARGVAAALTPRFAEGANVWFVDLSNARSELDLCFAVLSVLADRAELVAAASPAVVAALLEERGPALLVLDNFEHLAFAAGAIGTWLAASAKLSMLVTSRERLAIDGEVVLEVLPLDCPNEGADEQELAASEAVQLFQARARDAGARPSLDLVSIARIVRRLEGIPLAIELAAARTRLLSPRELDARLGRGEDVLATATKRANGRHRTLSDAIEWSWDLLSKDEQWALTCCAVFPSSFHVSAAERVIAAGFEGEPRAPAASAVELVSALREKSLVHAADDDRLGLYSSIREFALRKLEERGPARVAGARLAHARLYGDLARRFNQSRLLQNQTPEPTLHAEARREREHVVSALAYVSTRADLAEGPSLRLNFAAAAAFLFALPPEIADRELEAALSWAVALTTPDIRVARATAILARQVTENTLGRHDEALARGPRMDDDETAPYGLRCYAKVNAGVLLRARGKALEARRIHQDADAMLRSGGAGETALPRLVGMNTACMGRLECDLSHPEAARELNARATDMCDRLGDRWLAGLGLANLAQLEQEEQHFERARELLTRALERFRETSEPHYEAIYAGILGGLHFEWGNPEEARAWYGDAQTRLDALFLPFPRVVVHAGRAALEATMGASDAAHAHLELARRHALRASGAVARIVLEAHATTVELSLASGSASRSSASLRGALDGARARVRALLGQDTEDAGVVRTNLDARFAVRMLDKTLARIDARASSGPRLRTPKDGLWFALGDGPHVDLGRRGALRRILLALADAHARGRGETLDVASLTSSGWPNERILVEAASTRVRVAIATLRKLGLRDVLLTRDDGYLLDPEVVVERI